MRTLLILIVCVLTLVKGEDARGQELEFVDLNWKEKSSDRFMATVIQFASEVNKDPELKAEWEKQVNTAAWLPPLPEFKCDTSGTYPAAKTVHELRPQDISVIGAFGDSITAANGVGAERLLQVAWETRGESWSIGADFSLEEGVVTLANVLRKFNPDLKGASTCSSHYIMPGINPKRQWLNVAEPGNEAEDMPHQAQLIVDTCKADERIDVANDWKMLTLFIGGNDFCGSYDENRPPHYVQDENLPSVYTAYIEEALDILQAQLPRTFVNLVPMFDITPLNAFHNETLCQLAHFFFCEGIIKNEANMKALQMAYYEGMKNLTESGKYDDRDDFTVVLQPVFVNAPLPVDPETGLPPRGFLSPDCFHPSRGAHQSFAWSVWNSMFFPVGQKPMEPADLEEKWYCPSAEAPYLYTVGNSPPAP